VIQRKLKMKNINIPINMNFVQLIVIPLLVANAYAQENRPKIQWHKAKDTLIINRAIDLFNQERYEKAKAEIGKLKNRYYNEPGVLHFSAQCSYKLRRYDEAVTLYSLALGYSPQQIGIYLDRAFALMKWGKFKGASSDFAGYLIHYPDDKEITGLLAYCLAEDNQVDKAINYLENYNNKDSTLLNELAIYYTEFENKNLEAIEIWKEAIERYPEFYLSLENIAITYSEIDDYENAFHFIQKLIKLKPNYGRAYYLQGHFFDDIGDSVQAEKNYKIARGKGYSWKDD
jgi:tetratricopeptide (TPR) repeat protein